MGEVVDLVVVEGVVVGFELGVVLVLELAGEGLAVPAVVGLAVSAVWCLMKCPLPEGFSVPEPLSPLVPDVPLLLSSVVAVPLLLSSVVAAVPLLLSSVVEAGLSVLEASYLAASKALLYLSFSDWGKVISFIKVNVPKFIIS